jgi:hypothetical protein
MIAAWSACDLTACTLHYSSPILRKSPTNALRIIATLLHGYEQDICGLFKLHVNKYSHTDESMSKRVAAYPTT